MNILILGGGGREHALAWAMAQNPKCDRIVCAPGNAGIAEVATCVPLDIADPGAVAAAARAHGTDLAVIGPEAPLVAGVADRLRAAGIATLGPSAAAARLEGSKAFAKEICADAGIPTADWAHFADRAAARAHVRAAGGPIVVKADGLAAGKGVTVAPDTETALAAVDAVFAGAHGRAEVVIEAVLRGTEASLFVLADGEDAVAIGTAQDYKRLGDGDAGPNTGGMGAVSPAPALDAAATERAMAEIVRPALAEMARRGMPVSGVLFAGLMVEAGRPSLVEFNVRFGDPEAEVLMMRLGAQALDHAEAAAGGRLAGLAPLWAEDHAVSVVMAAPGYPDAPRRGDELRGLEAAAADPLVRVFHAGTAWSDGRLRAAGGRVLAVTARGESAAAARARAYAAVERIDWPGAVFRRDIAAGF